MDFCRKHQSVLLIKAWKIENIRITPLGGLWALKPLEERIAIGKIGIACFCFFYRVCCQIYLTLFIFNRCWAREHVLFPHQTNEDTTPPGFDFPKVSGRGGGGVCCAEERFVGRLLPLVSLPLIVLPPSCLFLEMLWFDLQARGLKVHMFEQRKFLGLFTHVWFEHICLLMFC